MTEKELSLLDAFKHIAGLPECRILHEDRDKVDMGIRRVPSHGCVKI